MDVTLVNNGSIHAHLRFVSIKSNVVEVTDNKESSGRKVNAKLSGSKTRNYVRPTKMRERLVRRPQLGWMRTRRRKKK
uniref:Ribosomal protein L23 n=1 Tax=Mesocestoides corti TaxID=53468 RepID=A0A5K3FZH8_MESCO